MHYNIAMSLTWLQLCLDARLAEWKIVATQHYSRAKSRLRLLIGLQNGGNRNEKEFRRK